MSNDNRIIFSREHNAWWAPNSKGYTSSEGLAGRYTFDEAERICAGGDEEFHYAAPEYVDSCREKVPLLPGQSGVPIDLFTLIVKHFNKKYPNRAAGIGLNQFVPLLMEVEAMFAGLPEVEKRKAKEPPHA